MATAIPLWKRILTPLWAALRSQWLATTLFIPLGFLLYSNHAQRQAAKEDRLQSVTVERIGKIQDSGKSLDLALASYFQSISDLGLAERNLRPAGMYENLTVKKAQSAVVERRDAVRKALQDHASDVQGLRGTLDAQASQRYMSALAQIDGTVERAADIHDTGKNITALSNLVVARNALVDKAVNKVS